jgi:succinate dehydrogenase/fumarate reductase flavoprotein subunit
MAGLAAAAEASRLGASVLVLEKGSRAGGSMLLSTGVIWRYREWERFRAECPGGDEHLQRAIYDRLDDDLRWLESLGVPVLERDTGNPATTGVHFDPAGLTGTLAGAAGTIELNQPLRSLPREVPVILATGGFQASSGLVRRFVTSQADQLLLRAARWSTGDGLRLGLEAGASLSAGMGGFYGRNMPAPPARVTEEGFVALQQLYAHHATVENADGERYEPKSWSEIDVVQWTARQPGARAWYHVRHDALERRVRDRTVGEMVEAARRAGARVTERSSVTTVEVVSGITTTLGGLRVGTDCRVAERLFACGADVGGVSTGGYSSGLAAALVQGRLAARAALETA